VRDEGHEEMSAWAGRQASSGDGRRWQMTGGPDADVSTYRDEGDEPRRGTVQKEAFQGNSGASRDPAGIVVGSSYSYCGNVEMFPLETGLQPHNSVTQNRPVLNHAPRRRTFSAAKASGRWT